MRNMKKLVACTAALLMFSSSAHHLNAADQYQEYAGGAGYVESRSAPSLAPAIALGAIAIVAIVAVAVQNQNNHGGHSHSH